MSLFSSKLERALWLWILIVVVTIYSTLATAGTLASYLRDRDLLDGAFLVLWLAMLVAIAAISLRSPRRGLSLSIAFGVAAVYGLAMIRMAIPEERSHLFEYSLVGVLVHQALSERRRQLGQPPAPALVAVLVTVAIGWLDEGIQGLLPSRVYDLRDVAFNTLAAAMGVGASVALSLPFRQRNTS